MWKTIEEVPVEILERYKNNDYAFEVPPVFTGNWSMLSWINYVFGGRKKFGRVDQLAESADLKSAQCGFESRFGY